VLLTISFRIGHKVQISGNLGTVRQLSLFWTELVGDDQVQVLVPNGGVWGQPVRNYSVYTAPPHLGEVRFPIDLERAIDEVNAIVKAQPQVLPEPAPKVLLDHSSAENALRSSSRFRLADDDTATVKSELIKAVHGALRRGPREQASP
jgi:small conductance mechanosensitive channel